jgi:hypothetical protein
LLQDALPFALAGLDLTLRLKVADEKACNQPGRQRDQDEDHGHQRV